MEEYITIKEAKESLLIPEHLHKYIMDTCDESSGGCGKPLYTNRNLTVQKCIDPRCILKLTGMLVNTLNNFGIIGIGPSFCRSFLKVNECPSHLLIFTASIEELRATGKDALAVDLKNKLEEVLESKYTFAEVVSNLSLPGFDETAKIVFRPFFNFKVFEEYLKARDLELLDYLLSLKGIGYKKATQIIEVIETFKTELEQLPKIFKLREPGKSVISLVITGEVGYYGMSKKSFIAYLNRVFEGYLTFEWNPEALTTADYVVCFDKYINHRKFLNSGEVLENKEEYNFMEEKIVPEMTSKHKRAVTLSKRYERDLLVKADELVELFKNKCERGEI